MVLVIPSVLAMLGDNPMQSEFCCHRGLAANRFCRVCWVQKGQDDEENDDSGPADDNDAATVATDATDAGMGRKKTKKKKTKKKDRPPETLEQMTERIHLLMKVCSYRIESSWIPLTACGSDRRQSTFTKRVH